MVFLAIDPSYSRTGVCVFDSSANTFYFYNCKGPKKSHKYKDLYFRALEIVEFLEEIFDRHKPDFVVLEHPLYRGIYAPGIAFLCGVILGRFEVDILAEPNLGRRLYKVKKWTKKDSVSMVQNTLGIKVNHDEADAFVLLIPFLPFKKFEKFRDFYLKRKEFICEQV